VARATAEPGQGNEINLIRRPLQRPPSATLDFPGGVTPRTRPQGGQHGDQKLGVKLTDGLKSRYTKSGLHELRAGVGQDSLLLPPLRNVLFRMKPDQGIQFND
jgi:hypothetical protein